MLLQINPPHSSCLVRAHRHVKKVHFIIRLALFSDLYSTLYVCRLARREGVYIKPFIVAMLPLLICIHEQLLIDQKGLAQGLPPHIQAAVLSKHFPDHLFILGMGLTIHSPLTCISHEETWHLRTRSNHTNKLLVREKFHQTWCM